jgi:hypothetical protein
MTGATFDLPKLKQIWIGVDDRWRPLDLAENG